MKFHDPDYFDILLVFSVDTKCPINDRKLIWVVSTVCTILDGFQPFFITCIGLLFSLRRCFVSYLSLPTCIMSTTLISCMSVINYILSSQNHISFSKYVKKMYKSVVNVTDGQYVFFFNLNLKSGFEIN